MRALTHVAAMAAAALVATAAPAQAQLILDKSLQKPADRNKPIEVLRTAPGRPNPNAQNMWPRLDAGAVLCRTQGDLAAHNRVVAARLDGTRLASVGTPDCTVVSTATPIDIVARAAPGQTQVRVKDQPARVGWTDAYLPDRQ